MRILTIVAALALAACSPAESPPPAEFGPTATPASAPAEPAPPPGADQASCVARGGEWRPLCRMQQPACVTKFSDAGKACTDGDDCAGDCMAPSSGGGFVAEGKAASGVCSANDDPCGCKQTVEGGRATAAICID